MDEEKDLFNLEKQRYLLDYNTPEYPGVSLCCPYGGREVLVCSIATETGYIQYKSCKPCLTVHFLSVNI